jgi:integrase
LPAGIQRHRSGFRVRKLVNGVRVVRSFAELEEAIRFLDDLSKKAESYRAARAPRLPGDLSIMQQVDRWFADPKTGRRNRLRPAAARSYDEHIKRYISKIGDHSAQELARNPRLLRAFYDSLPKVAALRVHTILSQAFEDALDHEEVTRNPCTKVRPNRKGTVKEERDTPTREEVTKIVAAASAIGERWGAFMLLVATLGLRRSEACAIRWEDFDFERRTVLICRAVELGPGPQTIGPTKSGRPRLLPAGPELFDALAGLREPSGYLFKGFFRNAQRSGAEKCWHPSSASHRFLKMIRGLGLIGESGKPYELHSLRHLVATELLVAGKALSQVARFMGHKNPSITQDLYGNHLVRDALRDVGETATRLVLRSDLPP